MHSHKMEHGHILVIDDGIFAHQQKLTLIYFFLKSFHNNFVDKNCPCDAISNVKVFLSFAVSTKIKHLKDEMGFTPLSLSPYLYTFQ